MLIKKPIQFIIIFKIAAKLQLNVGMYFDKLDYKERQLHLLHIGLQTKNNNIFITNRKPYKIARLSMYIN